MAIVFKYKNATSLSYAPGFANAGDDGDEGKQGVSGNTVYFVDYDLDNSYSIQLALQRIENNQILSSSSNKTIDARPYKENDLLMSKSGNMYRIVLANQTSAQNYKYDIEYLGSLHDTKPPLSISKIIIYDITGLSYDGVYYNDVTYTPTFNNRTEKTILDQNLTDDDKKLYGAWFKIFLVVEISSNDTEFEQNYFELASAMLEKYASSSSSEVKLMLEKYAFGLTILLNNKKSLQANSIPIDMGNGSDASLDPSPQELYQCFNMYKKLEFNNLCIIPKNSGDTFTDLVDRELTFAESYNIKNKYSNRLLNSFYLSDYAMDKMHPSGNNIRCTLSSDESSAIWFKTGIGVNDVSTNIDIAPLGDGFIFPFAEEGEQPNSSMPKYSKCQVTDLKYYNNMLAERERGNNPELSADIFSKYSIGRTLTSHTYGQAQYIVDNLDDTSSEQQLIQVSQRFLSGNTPTKNLRAGDSAYFSSLDTNYVKSELFKYLKNTANNKYILTVKNKGTKEITTVEVPVEFHTI